MGQFPQEPAGLYVTGIQVNFIPRFLVRRWSLFPVIIPSHVILGLGQGCFGFFQCILHMFFELINRLKVRLVLAGFKPIWGVAGSQSVILKLCKWKESNPIVLPLINEESKVLFQLLVNPLCLSTTLRMIGCSCCEFNAQKSIKFLHELCHKLWSSIWNCLFWQTMVFPDMLDI